MIHTAPCPLEKADYYETEQNAFPSEALNNNISIITAFLRGRPPQLIFKRVNLPKS